MWVENFIVLWLLVVILEKLFNFLNFSLFGCKMGVIMIILKGYDKYKIIYYCKEYIFEIWNDSCLKNISVFIFFR